MLSTLCNMFSGSNYNYCTLDNAIISMTKKRMHLKECATHTKMSLSGFDITAVLVVGCEYD